MSGFLKNTEVDAAPALRPDQLQPRIKHVAFIKALQASGIPPDQMPPILPLCGELLITFAFDLADSLQMATPQTLRDTGIAHGDMLPLALRNLKRAMPQPQFFAKNNVGLARTGNGLEATLLLTEDIWTDMQPNFSGQILVTVPRRDRILMCDSANVAAVGSLRDQTREFFNEHQDQHRLSTQILARQGQSWTLYDQQ